MAIRGIDHINIGTHRLEETRAFFRDVLGLTEGWRPDFPFGGAWLYAGDGAVVHLVDLAETKRPLSRRRRAERADPPDQPARSQRREHRAELPRAGDPVRGRRRGDRIAGPRRINGASAWNRKASLSFCLGDQTRV